MKIRFYQPLVKVVVTGLAAWALTTPARAQYVSTLISSNLAEPSSITVDPAGNAYIADSGHNRIAFFNPQTQVLSTFAGSATPGTNNGGAGAQFFNPTGVVYSDHRAGLVVVDQGNQMLRLVTLNGVVSDLAGSPSSFGGFADGSGAAAQFSFPTGLATDTNGNIYVADSGNNAIRLIDTNNAVHTLEINNSPFDFPEGVALDASGNLWVADSLNNAIFVISNVSPANLVNLTATLVAGAPGENGTNDGYTATAARFNLPSGLFWDAGINSLLVADSGNNTIRAIYLTNNLGVTNWAVRTVAGIPLEAGLRDGLPSTALFSQPSAIAPDPTDAGLYVVDSANNAVRVFLPTPPLPPVPAPQIGLVTFPSQGSPGVPESQFTATTNAILNNFNPPLIGITADPTAETYITYGPTPSDPLENNIPQPGPTSGQTVEIYQGDGLSLEASAPSILQPEPDLTIYAVSQSPGRRSSPVVAARFEFVCANPQINGINAAAIQLTDVTEGAQLWYTLNGTTPTNDGSSLGPVSSGQTLSINLQSNLLLNVRAFKNGFAPSKVSFETLSTTNFVANEMTFGFATGSEASSEFIAAAGQKFVAPVTLSLLPGATMYSLQFNVTVTNLNNAPSPGDNFAFQSMLKQPYSNDPSLYIVIPPLMFSGGGYTNGMFTNTDLNLLGVGWLARYSVDPLYNTISQTLITYSQAKDDLFLASGGKVIVGGYSFLVPTNAVNGDQYQIQIGRPSATADGVGVTSALIIPPIDGSLTNGSPNSIKNVTVGSAKYLVGDVNNFRWFNAGDFGDGNLDNSDVEEVFQTAVYNLNGPPVTSDMWNAMDSSNARTNPTPNLYTTIFQGNDQSANAVINAMQYGDGVLDISDVYVTYRRSLDPSLAWYFRYWSNGVLNVEATSNAPQTTAIRPEPVKTGVSVPHTLTVGVDSAVASGGVATVSLRVLAGDPNNLPVRNLMFDALVEPLDGSPALTVPVSFSADPNLGAPYGSVSKGTNDFSALWLDASVNGISGAGVIGTFGITLPAGASASSAYRVVITNFSASPNGLGVFQTTVQNGLITLSDRSASSWGDGISDAWRLLHFGTISDPNSAANADPDGDGASNLQEFLAGTDPLNAASVFALKAVPGSSSSAFSLQWPTVVGKTYTLQSSSSPNGGWTTLLSNVAGSGNPLNWTDTSGTQAKFFRAIVQ